MRKTQIQFIKDELLTNGKISRNTCLKNFISRLSGRIKDLRNEGWQFIAENVETEYGSDYVYRLIYSPERENEQKKLL